jgi:hypothetical protein
MLEIEIQELQTKPGRFSATLPNGHTIVTSSRTPFLDAARALLSQGANPNDTLQAHHKGSSTIALRGNLGRMAKLTVIEEQIAGLRIRQWEPIEQSPFPAPPAKERTNHQGNTQTPKTP